MISKNDLDLEFIPIDNREDIPKRGIRLIHIPSGIIAEYSKSTSVMKNYEECIKKLYRRLHEEKLI